MMTPALAIPEISYLMWDRKVSNSKSDIQRHYRPPLMMPFDRLHDFLLDFHCNRVSVLHHFREVTTYFPKFKEVTWPGTHSLRR